MKWLVDGQEIDFPGVDATVVSLPDRLAVRTKEGTFTAVVVRQGDSLLISYRGGQYRLERPGAAGSKEATHASGELRSAMPGIVVAVSAAAGEQVRKGQVLLVIEAMKTQLPIVAPFEGHLDKVEVAVGDRVSEGKVLAFLTQLADTEQRVGE